MSDILYVCVYIISGDDCTKQQFSLSFITMASTLRDTQTFWREFIQLYRDCPALWKVKSDEYKNRKLKSECYVKLIDKIREIDPNATRSTVTKKINGLRSNYRRELRKVMNSGGGGGGAYKPSLWYFHDLAFLRAQELHQERVSSLLLDEGEEHAKEDSIDKIVGIHSCIFIY